MTQIVCSNCGHDNLPRAIFCFECGQNLTGAPIITGIKPRYHELIASTDTAGHPIQPRTVESVKEHRDTRENSKLYNARLTCLRCATVNDPHATECVACGAALTLADELHHLRIVGSARSSVGRVRTNNEDTVGLWARSGVIVGMVADGMGGAAAGEEASRLAKEAIQADFMGASRGSENLPELSEDEVAQKIRLAIDHANEALLNRIRQEPLLAGMGTTITLAMARGDRVIIGHIGDSRAYLIDGTYKWIHQITDDHSFVEVLLASGHITRAQASKHPMRSVLYRALGQSEAVGGADLYIREVKAGDRILLCSDGLVRHVSNDEILQVVLHYDDPETIAQTLIDLTNERGAEDNVSIVVFVVQPNTEEVPIETLRYIAGEPQAGSDEGLMFSTGRIPTDELEKARAEARKRSTQTE